MKRVIYTALAGKKSPLQVPKYIEPDCEYICFTDNPAQVKPPWQYKPLEVISNDPNRNAKQYKLQPNKYFPDADQTIWIDANFRIDGSLFDLFTDSDLTLFKHFERSCLYQEASACLSARLDSPEIINNQIERYRADNFPEQLGLPECGIILRNNTLKANECMDFWWHEVIAGSRRDQLSFMYSVWKTDTDLTILDMTTRDNLYVTWVAHYNMGPLLRL